MDNDEGAVRVRLRWGEVRDADLAAFAGDDDPEFGATLWAWHTALSAGLGPHEIGGGCRNCTHPCVRWPNTRAVQ